MGRRRRTNPSTTTWLMIGGAAAVAVAAGVGVWIVYDNKLVENTPTEVLEGAWVDEPLVDGGSQIINAIFGTVYLNVPKVTPKKSTAVYPKPLPPAKPTSSTAKGQGPQRVDGPPPPPPPAPQQGKPAGGSDATPSPVSPGKASIQRLPKPKTIFGWTFWKSYGPYRDQAYSVYLEHGVRGWRWGITGVGPVAGASSKYWSVSRKVARRQAEDLLRIAFSKGRSPIKKSTLAAISRNDALFPNTWSMS